MKFLANRNRLNVDSSAGLCEPRVMLASATGASQDANVFDGFNKSDIQRDSLGNKVPGRPEGVTEQTVYVREDANGLIDLVLTEEQRARRERNGTLPRNLRKTERRSFLVPEGIDKRAKPDGRDENGERILKRDENGNVLPGVDARSEFEFRYRITGDGRQIERNNVARSEDEEKNAAKTATFEAYYDVKSAEKTTIFQMLNIQNGKGKPQLFVEAFSVEDDPSTTDVDESSEYVKLINTANRTFETGDQGEREEVPLYVGPRQFNLKVISDGKSGEIFVNNESRGGKYNFDRDKDTETLDLPGNSFSQFRLGAYHHDRRTIQPAADRIGRITQESASEALVDVTDARLTFV